MVVMGMSPYLYVYGGSGLVRGVLELALMTNASGPAITFAHMPMTTMDEVQARLDYGERELSTLAERSMISRILDGSLSIGTGLAIIPIMFAANDSPFDDANLPFAIIAIATASISTISGVITLIQTTAADQRRSASVVWISVMTPLMVEIDAVAIAMIANGRFAGPNGSPSLPTNMMGMIASPVAIESDPSRIREIIARSASVESSRSP